MGVCSMHTHDCKLAGRKATIFLVEVQDLLGFAVGHSSQRIPPDSLPGALAHLLGPLAEVLIFTIQSAPALRSRMAIPAAFT